MTRPRPDAPGSGSGFPDPGRPLTSGETLEVHGPEQQVARVRALAQGKHKAG